MDVIPVKNLSTHDRDNLRVFLMACQDAAFEKGHFQLASISLEVNYISPLAVLEAIYDPDELHFYVERPSGEEALAGVEAVIQQSFSGPERFAQARDFARDVLDNTVAVGDLEAPFAGPHFFTAFSFADSVPETNAFPATTIFVPRWQVSRSGGRYGAVANLRVDSDSDIDQLVERVWAAYDKFNTFDYESDAPAKQGDAKPRQILRHTELGNRAYQDAVQLALKDITAGAYQKVVLSRGIELESDQDWRPLRILDRLRERFNDCFTFSFGNGAGSSFIGATPERLLKIEEGRLQTEAIAGSAPRGTSVAEDANRARALLESVKDIHEHEVVRDSILRRLEVVGVKGIPEGGPRLLALANVQHLRTTIKATVDSKVHLLDVASELHPTPAVGGTPREAALAALPRLEEHERGLYAGALGWFNHKNDGEMIVGIRSALIKDRTATVYAGAGIVNGSQPENETRETEMKLHALYQALDPTRTNNLV
jgi:menaquinone-specific isochorismate synthase